MMSSDPTASEQPENPDNPNTETVDNSITTAINDDLTRGKVEELDQYWLDLRLQLAQLKADNDMFEAINVEGEMKEGCGADYLACVEAKSEYLREKSELEEADGVL